MANLSVDNLQVESFATTSAALPSGGLGFCCTGCDSGCGIFPTAGTCQSNGDSKYCDTNGLDSFEVCAA